MYSCVRMSEPTVAFSFSEPSFWNLNIMYKMTSCDLKDNHSLMWLYTHKLETQGFQKMYSIFPFYLVWQQLYQTVHYRCVKIASCVTQKRRGYWPQPDWNWDSFRDQRSDPCQCNPHTWLKIPRGPLGLALDESEVQAANSHLTTNAPVDSKAPELSANSKMTD